MDLAAMCNLASESVRAAIKLNDDLHLELAHQRVKEHWPMARTWTRQYVEYDDMPGGDWYLTDVKDADGVQLRKLDDEMQDTTVEEINNILADIREDADYNLAENTITIE
jgi:hypothetical protein